MQRSYVSIFISLEMWSSYFNSNNILILWLHSFYYNFLPYKFCFWNIYILTMSLIVIGQLFWHVGCSHMSPEIFPNPKTFDPSRFGATWPPLFTYLAFIGGPHLCIGIEYTRTEMVVFLHHLVLNYEWSMVDLNEPIAMDPFPTFQKGLHLKIHKKMSSQIS
jgi:hypothetical protein